MKTLKQFQPKILAAAVLIGLFGLSGNGFAAPGGAPGPNPNPGGGGGGGGNPPPEETAGNNLSMPTKFVPGNSPDQPSPRITCPVVLTAPSGTPTSLDPPPITDNDGNTVDLPQADYFLQKTDSTWSGDCVYDSATTVTATTKWGDNLVGDGQLSARKPIRVEMSLTENNGTEDHQGYKVWKLTDEEDRFATYGTRGATDLLTGLPYMVFDSGAQFSIDKCTNSSAAGCDVWTPLINKGPMSAEINSTGKVVWGYNWGVSTKGVKQTPDAGTYRLRFYANTTTITQNADAKATMCVTDPSEDNCSEVIVTLTAGGGGGKPPGAGE